MSTNSNTTSNGTTVSSRLEKKDEEFLSNFSMSLIRRVLLTDPADFSNLTFSGEPISHEALSFARHVTKYTSGITRMGSIATADGGSSSSSSSNLSSQIEWTIKKAFHDNLVESIQSTHCYDAIKPLIIELHSNLKGLIPNRTDLHALLEIPSILNQKEEEEGKNQNGTTTSSSKDSFLVLLKHLIQVADALSRLESEFQSESTQGWINGAKTVESTLNKGDVGSNSIIQGNIASPLTLSFSQAEQDECVELGIEVPLHMSVGDYVVSSVTYLHAKIEQCQTDVANFQLSHVLAPRIRAFGIDYIRLQFQRKFGGEVNLLKQDKLPHTTSWIQELVDGGELSSSKREEALESIEVRRTIIWTVAWIRNLLFRSPRNPREEEEGGDSGDQKKPRSPFLLPEVFMLDFETIKEIRKVTQWSVVGSALALHASNAAGVGQGVLQIPLGQNVMIDNCRQDLKDCLQGKAPLTAMMSQEEFENAIIDKVLKLTQAWNQSLTSVAQETIRSRCLAVLRGSDPVLQLFDTRMRNIFEAMVVWTPSQSDLVPSTLKTGISIHSSQTSPSSRNDSLFLKSAKKEITAKGFAFYAQDLADAALKSRACIDLVWRLFGLDILDPLLLNVLKND